jgi:hypothetical protein
MKLKELHDIEKNVVGASSRLLDLEDLNAEVEINSSAETIRENIKISVDERLGYYGLTKHKTWLDKG